ncbi:nose resistant to fluoxetine protein 6-like [Neocloeon triangulifer]|uniref:nose resistant to fluoxetine protein 6-like n=1 Tax=Neocloeon triangulifer TaxID=2078957 RepID=UPI00286F458D|nr:nose resistant to fluoxetine protein 6-like [Neocloeon triangulifer]
MLVTVLALAVASWPSAAVAAPPQLQMPPMPLAMATPWWAHLHGDKCKNESAMFVEELHKLTLWAVQMFDSSAKFPSGVMYGQTYAFGNYDECMSLSKSGSPVPGQYCLARVQLRPSDHLPWGSAAEDDSAARTFREFISAPMPPKEHEPRIPKHDDDDPNASVWLKVQRTITDPSKKRRDVLHWGLCVPSSCDKLDVEAHLRAMISPLGASLGLEGSIRVQTCEKADTEEPLSVAAIILIIIICVSVAFVAFGTTYDLTHSIKDGRKNTKWKPSRGEQVVLCFSVYRNLKRLVSTEADEHHLKCMHGIKLYSMACVMLGHRLMFSLGSPIHNPEFIEGYYERLDTMILLNGFIIVDTFFTISGFLVCFLLLTAYSKNVKVPIPVLYIHRYIRLTPVYAVVVCVYACLLQHLGSGPIWSAKVGREVTRCADNWWANLLYINNYVNTDAMCMFQSWYLSCDMHLFVISVPIVALLWKRPTLGKAVLTMAIVTSILVPFAVTLLQELDALLLLYMNTLEDPISNQTFRMMYAPTHTRGSPYFIGMAFGYLTFLAKHQKFKVSQRTRRICWWSLSALPAASMLSAWIFYLPGREYIALEAAVYGALHRVGWSLGISWIVFAVCTGGKGVVNLMLSMKPVIALSRLTYCAFLCHGALQLYSVATIRVPVYMSIFSLLWMTMGDILMAFFGGALLSLLFESPFLALEKILLRKKIKETIGKASAELPECDSLNQPITVLHQDETHQAKINHGLQEEPIEIYRKTE